ncbi:hypothetical protein ACTFIZ_006964 [Dictyostelium cf. discoideum]
MTTYKCGHDFYSLEDLKKYGYRVCYDGLVDSKHFPKIKSGYCDEECKTKMKEIYKIAMGQFLTSTQRYYEDARIFEYAKQKEHSFLIYYERFFELKEMKEDPKDGKYKFFNVNQIKVDPIKKEYKLVLINFKVGILNGKPVRFCDLPEGTKCDYDADHLPENCTQLFNYYHNTSQHQQHSPNTITRFIFVCKNYHSNDQIPDPDGNYQFKNVSSSDYCIEEITTTTATTTGTNQPNQIPIVVTSNDSVVYSTQSNPTTATTTATTIKNKISNRLSLLLFIKIHF